MEDKNYIEINRNLWNARTPVHLESEFYNMEGFRQKPNSLNKIELDLLGDIKGKTALHLQCHFGQDTLSLAGLGAIATGVDFSEKAIDAARKIAGELHMDCTFICCDVYELPKHLHKKFDLIFCSYGTIGWLPDLTKWAALIAQFLNPGGKFVFVEFHPFVWMFDNNLEKISYSYFNVEPVFEIENGTYTNRDAPISNECISWNHPLSDVLGCLLKSGLQLTDFQEYDYSPYNCFSNMVEIAEKKYQVKQFENKMPMVYSLVLVK